MTHLRTFPLIIVLLFLTSCSREKYNVISGYAQGGTYIIKCSEGDIPPAQLKEGIDSILTLIESAVSGYNPESVLSKANNAQAIDSTSASFEVFQELTAIGDSIFRFTDGAVDTRAGALYDVWGFGFKNNSFPSQEDINAVKDDRSKLNFNAIAQGFSSDKVAAYLKRHKVANILVNIGGEIYCKGTNPSGKGWSIGIDAPTDGNMSPGQNLSETFTMPKGCDCGVVTSGNYRKFYIVDGVKYSHTIDPRTASPVRNDLLSATIIAETSTLADAIATYCMVVGIEGAKEFIQAHEGMEACLILSDTTWCSEGFNVNR